MQEHHFPTVVIGAGAGGLVVAIGLSKAGRRVLLVEEGLYGGDCTNYGCVPSKALIASAEAAYSIQHAPTLGIELGTVRFDASRALDRVRDIVKGIRHHEEPTALRALGVETLNGRAEFEDPHHLLVRGKDERLHRVTAHHFVIATGSQPRIPDLPGLDQIPYLTNENIFELQDLPEHLAILGGGPIGCELGQACRRLGSQVSLIQDGPRLLAHNEPEASATLAETFRHEGIQLFLSTQATRAREEGGLVYLTLQQGASSREIACSHLLVATGRKANSESLCLAAAEVQTHPDGSILVDRYGRSTQKHIWAIGDVSGGAPFTHMAESEGRAVLTSLLLPGPLKKKLQDSQSIPHCTFTDPEVAGIGLTEAQAVELYGARRLAVYHFPFSQLDRAITTGRTEGHVKFVTKKWSSRILGASVVGPGAGELLGEISLAMAHNIPLRKLASIIHPYPTYSLALRKAADLWLTQTVLPTLKKWTGRS